jgi:hypothetical protein
VDDDQHRTRRRLDDEESQVARVGDTRRPTLNTAVRRRRADRAFYLRLAGAIRQHERALERLKR